MFPSIKTKVTLVILPFMLLQCGHQPTIEDLQREFVEMRFGAFFHFGIRTFTGGEWGEANQDISKFNPTNLDCGQWADVLVAAKMKYGILTTKHHDGFCLWNSKYSDYDVASIPWREGKGDVLREFVEAFRAHDLVPCFYYSVWDNTAGIGNGPITPEDMAVIKGQIAELLTGYGPVGMLFMDGWSWKMGHQQVPYQEIHELVKSLQPNCLLVDNTHLRCLYDMDLIHYEWGSPYPEGNTYPAIFSLLINKDSGNGWFWDKRVPDAELLSVKEIVDDNLRVLEPQWCSFILNCPPNPQGLLDESIVNRLKEAGEVWAPHPNRPELPAQGPQIVHPITAVSAAATSGNASYAIDGFNDRYYYSVWESDSTLPQSVTIDLGRIYPNVSILNYVPKYKPYIQPLSEGSIKQFKIYSSVDNQQFTEIASGEWNGDSNMKTVAFPPVSSRYIRLEAITAMNDFAAATEISAGVTDFKKKLEKK